MRSGGFAAPTITVTAEQKLPQPDHLALLLQWAIRQIHLISRDDSRRATLDSTSNLNIILEVGAGEGLRSLQSYLINWGNIQRT